MSTPADLAARRPGPFSLRAVVRSTARATSEADPRKVADLVLAQLSPQDQHAALRQAIAAAVRQLSRWDGVKAARVCVADRWTRLADCDATALRGLAADRRANARQAEASAREFDALAAQLEAAGAATVRDLDRKTASRTA